MTTPGDSTVLESPEPHAADDHPKASAVLVATVDDDREADEQEGYNFVVDDDA